MGDSGKGLQSLQQIQRDATLPSHSYTKIIQNLDDFFEHDTLVDNLHPWFRAQQTTKNISESQTHSQQVPCEKWTTAISLSFDHPRVIFHRSLRSHPTAAHPIFSDLKESRFFFRRLVVALLSRIESPKVPLQIGHHRVARLDAFWTSILPPNKKPQVIGRAGWWSSEMGNKNHGYPSL